MYPSNHDFGLSSISISIPGGFEYHKYFKRLPDRITNFASQIANFSLPFPVIDKIAVIDQVHVDNFGTFDVQGLHCGTSPFSIIICPYGLVLISLSQKIQLICVHVVYQSCTIITMHFACSLKGTFVFVAFLVLSTLFIQVHREQQTLLTEGKFYSRNKRAITPIERHLLFDVSTSASPVLSVCLREISVFQRERKGFLRSFRMPLIICGAHALELSTVGFRTHLVVCGVHTLKLRKSKGILNFKKLCRKPPATTTLSETVLFCDQPLEIPIANYITFLINIKD